MENNEERISKYNQALASLLRLDNLWYLYNQLVLSGKLKKSVHVLDRIYAELSADATEEDSKICLIHRKLAYGWENYSKKLKEASKGQYGVASITDDVLRKKVNGYIYPKMMNFELFLRKLQNKQGKGSSYISKDEESLD